MLMEGQFIGSNSFGLWQSMVQFYNFTRTMREVKERTKIRAVLGIWASILV